MMRIFTYFPKNVIVNNSDPSLYNGILSQVNLVYHGKPLTPEQIYVIINDFTFIKESWDSFIQLVTPTIGAQKLPEQILDPVPYTKEIVKAIPNLFGGLIEHEVYSYISQRLWVENSGMKTIFNKKASKKILHPEFESHSSQFFNTLYNNSIEFITEKCNSLKQYMRSDKLNKMLESFIKGLDAGLMNVMINDEEPIKHKRIEVILDFIKTIHNELYNEFKDEHDINSVPYLKWMWKSKLMLESIHYGPKEILSIALKENGQRGLIFFILARSFTNDKLCTNWAIENQSRFLGMRFSPRD